MFARFFLVLAIAAVVAAEVMVQRPDYVQSTKAEAMTFHEVIFAVKQRNLDILEKTFWEVSDPKNEKYGKFMTREQVADLTANPEGTKVIVDYLKGIDGIVSINPTLYGEYIRVKAPIHVWESIFKTSFYTFKHAEGTSPSVDRALSYTLEDNIATFVDTVWNTVQLPPIMKYGAIHKEGSAVTGTITPATLNKYYGITSNTGNSKVSQSVFETIGQYYSPSDLAQFQKTYGLPNQPVAVDIGGFASDTQCTSNANNCAEANLDVQYMMAVSQVTPMTYYYDGASDSFTDWITSLANMQNPPLINSVSYGSTETSASYATKQWDTEAQKLGVQGVSIFVSSGDDGAAGSGARTLSRNCAYNPSFPATSVYITSVGATQGPESGTTETVCMSNTGGVITSGGGFSKAYTAPSYQTAAIKGYFAKLNSSSTPVSGYVTTGRGYPDIAIAGLNYNVVIGGKTYSVSGTSASAPVIAAIVSLVNAGRVANGKAPLGFINTALYNAPSSLFNDVVTGNNKCTAGSVCCTQGFYAAAGWDPATGFGSPKFSAFYNYLYAL